MVDFAQAFEIGVEIAEKHLREKNEIAEVFNTLSMQLSSVLNNQIIIKVSQIEITLKRPVEASLKERIEASIHGSIRSSYIPAWLPVSNQDVPILTETVTEYKNKIVAAYADPLINRDKKILADWSDNNGAYPCIISYDNERFMCSNREELEQQIAEMLKNPLIAKKLLAFRKSE